LNATVDKCKTIVGTPYYLSPEIVQNKPYSFKSDIWSLGILLYEMCALKMPFDAQSLPMLSLKIIRGAYNPLPATLSKELRNLVSIMLAVDTNKRPSINEVLKQSIIKSRIKYFLNEMDYNKEFSHTILHNFNVLKNPPPNKISTTESTTLATNGSQSNLANEKRERKEKEKDSNYNNIGIKEVNTPSQNQKPIIFDKKENVGANLKNIIDINNNKNGDKNEKKNYHYEKKDSVENKREKIGGNVQEKKKSAMNNPSEVIMESNRIIPQKDRKKDSKEQITKDQNE